ncbi:MAG: CHAP domain-containing protein [Patescibacteria group bacterium]|nr:CHAP domain-containing protein [Patescibacteria group bacterium]
MDWLDFGLKFSSELLVLILAGAVAFLNLFFFAKGNTNKILSDNSPASKFLSNHVALNEKYYAKSNSIITTVEANSFFTQAQADQFAGLSTQAAAADPAADGSALISDGAIVKPNPDSIQALLDKQIKVYQTQAGDSLKSIAAANKISIQTIKWANNLAGDTIQPGWYLLIPPVDGTIAKADSNTTLPDLAAKFNPEKYNKDKNVRDAAADQLLKTIISYNGLANAEDIDAGQIIVIPGGVIATPPAPPKPKTAPKSGSVAPAQPTQVDNGTGHIFPWGYCTWYVASKIHVPWGGNAKNWLANARAYGAVTNSKPAAGAIVVTNENTRYGHVAIVEKVTDDSIYVSEMNYNAFGKVDYRYIPIHSSVIRGYIYP